jgi:hypothetical protein
LNPFLGRPPQKLAADPPNPPAQQPNQPTSHPQASPLPHSLPGRAHTSATAYPSLPHLFFFALSCGRSTKPVRQAGDAMGAPAERPARRGPEHAHRVPDPTEGGGKDLNTPHRAHPRPEQAAATGSTCPFPANGQEHWGESTPGCLWPLFKRAPGRRGTDAKPPTPLGFSTRHRPCLRRLGGRRKRAAAASRRAREEPGAGQEQGHLLRRDAVDTLRTSSSTAARGKESRPSASGKGAGLEQGQLHRRERLLRHATARPRPGHDYTADPT